MLMGNIHKIMSIPDPQRKALHLSIISEWYPKASIAVSFQVCYIACCDGTMRFSVAQFQKREEDANDCNALQGPMQFFFFFINVHYFILHIYMHACILFILQAVKGVFYAAHRTM